MELACILTPIFLFVLAKMVIDHRAAARADNVRLLEEALKSPHVDRQLIETLTWQLTGNRPRPGGSRLVTLLLAVGWVGLFTGLGMLAGGEMARSNDVTVAGAVVAIIGFGVITFPFALREFEARRQPQ